MHKLLMAGAIMVILQTIFMTYLLLCHVMDELREKRAKKRWVKQVKLDFRDSLRVKPDPEFDKAWDGFLKTEQHFNNVEDFRRDFE